MPINTPVFWYCPSINNDSPNPNITDNDDSLGSYPITNTGAWVTDTNDGGVRAVELDGSTQSHSLASGYPTVFNSMDLSNGEATICGWIRADGFGGRQTLVSISNNDGVATQQSGYELAANTSGGQPEAIAYSAGSSTLTISGGSSPPGSWLHLAMTIDRDTSTNSTVIKLYVDGTLRSTSSATTLADNDLNKITVGGFEQANGTVTSLLDGRWDDVRGYDEILSDADILDLASERGYIRFEGLGTEVAHWCPSWQDDSAESTVTDYTGNGHDLTNFGIAASNWVADTDEGGVRAITLNGTDEHHQGPAVVDGREGTDFTMSIWVKNTSSRNDAWYMGQNNTLADQDWYGLGYSDNAGGERANSYRNSTPTRSLKSTEGTQTRNVNVWQHYLATVEWSGSTQTITFYLDGVGYASESASVTISADMNATNIGAVYRSSGTNLVKLADITWDDARIFDSVLTQAEITHLASARGVEGPPGDPVNGLPAESASDAEIVNITVRDPLPVTDAESVTQAEQVDISIRTVSPVDAESVTDAETASVPLATSVSLLDGQSLTQAQRVAVVKRYGLTLVDTESITEGGRVDIQNNPDLTAVNAESLSDAEQVEIGASPTVFGQAAQSRSDAEVLDNNALLIHKSITVTDAVSVTDAATLELDSLRSIAVTDSQSLSEAESVLLPRLQVVALDTQSVSDAARLQIGVNPLVGFGQGFTMSTGFFDLNGFL